MVALGAVARKKPDTGIQNKSGCFLLVSGNGRPAGGSLPVTVAGRVAGLHRVYSARRRSPLLTGIQKSPMLSHEAFPFI